mmetsp:Transcript_100873/g.289979  ORF Transcript_100873/g.289979 Transcript_100873/m.289979 type:complete len:226 (+) Transcript_100873:727-1404(+)
MPAEVRADSRLRLLLVLREDGRLPYAEPLRCAAADSLWLHRRPAFVHQEHRRGPRDCADIAGAEVVLRQQHAVHALGRPLARAHPGQQCARLPADLPDHCLVHGLQLQRPDLRVQPRQGGGAGGVEPEVHHLRPEVLPGSPVAAVLRRNSVVHCARQHGSSRRVRGRHQAGRPRQQQLGGQEPHGRHHQQGPADDPHPGPDGSQAGRQHRGRQGQCQRQPPETPR